MNYPSKKEILFFCVREEPIVFLRLEKDFMSYTPRRKENLHENLNNLRRELIPEKLELAIRKEVWDSTLALHSFISSNSTFHCLSEKYFSP